MKAYSIQEAAAVLSVDPETVKREIQRNKIKAFKVGYHWRIHESRLMEYMDVVENNFKTKNEAALEEKVQELEKENTKLRNIIGKISNTLIEVHS